MQGWQNVCLWVFEAVTFHANGKPQGNFTMLSMLRMHVFNHFWA